MPEVLAPTTFDPSGLSELHPLARSPVFEAGSQVCLIDFDRSITEPDGGLLEVTVGPSEREEGLVDPMVGDLHSLRDAVVGEAELEPVQELVDLKEAKPLPGQWCPCEKAEPLPALPAAPAAVVQAPELPRLAALGTPRPIPEAGCTEDSFGACDRQITQEDLFQKTRESSSLVRETSNALSKHKRVVGAHPVMAG